MDKFQIIFYYDDTGNNPVFEFFEKLRDKAKKDKMARTLLDNFYRRLNSLRKNGTSDGLPHFDSIKSSKYPLREVRIKHPIGYYRILFCPWNGNSFVLLHVFLKKVDKTPPRDIKLAEKRIEDWVRRNGGKI
ncbi:type II toxin-antitoxin system RelE/ParE family toxin [Thermincola ferriacetica]